MVTIQSNEIVRRYDDWIRQWYTKDPDEVRLTWIQFLLRWREQSCDWFQGEAGRFFDRARDRVDLGGDEGFWNDLQRLHLCNHVIWNFEDEARRDDVDADRIVDIKRGIDAVNQQRNDQMEKIDEYFVQFIQPDEPGESVPMHTEPPGLILDRLSIMSLKIFHYDYQSKRQEVESLQQQRKDLGRALDQLIKQMKNGEVRIKVYRQFKTYNDPETNPALENVQ